MRPGRMHDNGGVLMYSLEIDGKRIEYESTDLTYLDAIRSCHPERAHSAIAVLTQNGVVGLGERVQPICANS